jgi:hypothetical protein
VKKRLIELKHSLLRWIKKKKQEMVFCKENCCTFAVRLNNRI